ncbi:hypothetical protein FraEuI1c_2860 [Pseudofrankia inefficax]|uniref:Leucine-binding protein domain-containing protein n=1 Tax=Pseudofrankia inefficax (strain DSM 45817 / CECT 9037 / DDB 130130 / EuI1c) TaxID=298654 RepID=E3J907_PSEI1|nr:hypothetical protein FraEuI1c_2860 [Pseudofrankia inefficax]
MFRRACGVVAAIAATTLVVAACGSSGSGGGGGALSSSTAGSRISIKVGILTDATGPGNATAAAVDGIKAGIYNAKKDGIDIQYVVADTGTNPATAVTAATRLVQQDHVTVVMAYSSVLFAAAPYLAAHNVPVVGVAQDGPEWISDHNMFSVFGPAHQELVSTTFAKFFKQQGATILGSLGYGIAPNSALAAKALGVSGPAEGLTVGYMNPNFAFGGTDVGPVALAVKNAHVDGFQTTTAISANFTLLKAMRDINGLPKTVVLFTGYGAELINAGAAAQRDAQGVYFPISYEPVELNTPATQRFQAARKAVGLTGIPSYAEYFGYAGVDLLEAGLKGSGPTPSAAKIISTLSTVHDFTAYGLTGDHSFDVNDRTHVVNGPANCMWFTQFENGKFVPVKGASPLCGELLEGKTVSLTQ